jgi:hypothetical protein
MKAQHFSASAKLKGILCQQNIRMAPDKAAADAFPPGVSENVPEFDHLGPRRENRGLHSESRNAFEQLLLTKA